jgi:hypothetical protein
MESNMHSDPDSDRLAALTAAVDKLEALDFDGLPHAVKVEWALELRGLLDLLELQWLRELAAADARGAAGAEQGTPAASTAVWLRDRLNMDADAAITAVRTARAYSPIPDSHRTLMRSLRRSWAIARPEE